MTYQHAEIEKKWQKKWKEVNIYKADNKKSRTFYNLVELAYSSGDLHIGHWFSWSAPDVYARFKRMQGYNVLFPVGGFDSFGLPAENAAIKRGVHPEDWTNKNIEAMRKQFETMGPSFDWDREVVASSPNYYKWTQWLFIKLYQHGLIYKDKVTSNWCPQCQTVLANEHVENGHCWRHSDTEVVQKKVEQWLVRITDYADRLIWPKNPTVDWPKAHTEGQNNWIGRSVGVEIDFQVKGSNKKIRVFTTAHDTIYGATFLVIAPEYAKELVKLVPSSQKTKVSKYIEKAIKKSEEDRKKAEKTKTGLDTGMRVINPFSEKEIPVFVADYVLMNYGTGAVMAVPGHDERDNEFAHKYNLPIEIVVKPSAKSKPKVNIKADGFWSYSGEIKEKFAKQSELFNSGILNSLNSFEARKKIEAEIVKRKIGKKVTNYHLRDWTISRHRYWGAPIPIIYCDDCGVVPVPEKDLPVTLPRDVDYTPTGKAPLATAEDWVKVKCPKCAGPAERETQTLDTYVDSSWYFLRYIDPKNVKEPFSKKLAEKWMPVDIYFGGSEHVYGHTLYARFVTKFLKDIGYLNVDEFAKKRVNHGIVLGPDGQKMSKSKGNVVNPDVEVAKYGADTVRMYLCFMGPHENAAPWKREGVEGMHKFVNRLWELFNRPIVETKVSDKLRNKQYQTIKKVTSDLERLQFNTALAAIMEYTNELRQSPTTSHQSLVVLAQLIAPFAPHLAEEAWQKLNHSSDSEFSSIHLSKWPQYSSKDIKVSKVIMPVQVNGKLRAQVKVDSVLSGDEKVVTQKALKDTNVVKHIGSKKYKIIFVPGKIINFIVK